MNDLKGYNIELKRFHTLCLLVLLLGCEQIYILVGVNYVCNLMKDNKEAA
jgi:hypothetical protein